MLTRISHPSPVLRRAAVAGAGLLLALILATVSILPSSASGHISVEVLTPRSVFTDDVNIQIRNKLSGGGTAVSNMTDPSRTVVARITVAAKGQFPWHTHPGPVIVNVSQGELVYVQANDCVERSYPQGTAFIDPGRGNVHTAYNPLDTPLVLVATFFEVPPAPAPLTITDGVIPGDCEIQVGTHGH